MSVVGLLLPVLVSTAAAAAVLLWSGEGPAPAPPQPRTEHPPGPRSGARTPGRNVRGSVSMSWKGFGRLARRWRPARAERERDTELQVLDGLAAALEAGLPVPQAVRLAVSQVGQTAGGRPDPGAAWEELARAAGEGQALAPVWERLARRSDSPTLASVARAWRVAAVTGAPMARAIRVSAHASRERRRLERAALVATAGARATVTVLTLLPLTGAGLAAVLGVPPTTLYSHPVALASVGTGAVLLLLGQVWSRRMVAGVLRGHA